MERSAAAFLLLAVSCGGVTSDGLADSSTTPFMDGSAASNPEDAGTYHQGSSYTCCGRGRELTCCTADAGLLGYEIESDGAIVPVGGSAGSTEANCFRYGGAIGACATEGESFDGKDICSLCCDGLSRVHPAAPGDGGTCMNTAPPSLFECQPCGNGACDRGENRCTCPDDCP